MKINNIKNRVIDFLTKQKDFICTAEIARGIGVHSYTALAKLVNLLLEGKIDRLQLGRITYWKLK